MIKGIHHSAIHVSDMDRALVFYRDVLGFEVIWNQEASGEFLENLTQIPHAALRAVLLRAGEERGGDRGTVELIQMRSPEPRDLGQEFPDVRSAHVAFSVEDLLATYEALRAKGVEFNCPPQHVDEGVIAGWNIVYFKDPDGNTIEFVALDNPPSG